MPGMLSKINPVPKLYRCPCSRIISPTYIRNVIMEATSAGIPIETKFRFPKRNEPTYTPTVTPKIMKNAVIKVADRGDT